MDEDAKRALRVLAALEQEHNEHLPDDRPLFAINGAMVLMGDVRAAKRALADVPRGTSVVPEPFTLPIGLDVEAWDEWQRYRRERRLPKYKTDKMARWLAAKPLEQQAAIVEQSVRMNYTGLFDLKGNGNGQGAESRYDRLGKEFERRAASVLSVEPAAANVRDALDGAVRAGAERLVDSRRR